MSDNMWAAQYDERAENAKKAQKDRAFNRKQADRAQSIHALGEDKVNQMERAGNTAGGK